MRTSAFTFNGHGDVYQGEKWLAWARYSIKTWLTSRPTTTLADEQPQSVVVGEGASGQLSVLRGDFILPIGESCILVLEDGRRCRVFFSLEGSPVIDSYTIQFENLADLA
jgi:hypothetical protein